MPDLEELQRQIEKVRVMAEDALDRFPIRSTTTPGAAKERHIHDLGKHPGGVIAARVHNSGAITISNNSTTALTFDSERYDTDTIHSTSSNTGRLTVNTGGKYIITGNVSFAGDSTGKRNVSILLNGSTVIARQHEKGLDTSSNSLSVTTVYDLSADDYVELTVFQDSGGDLDVEASSNFSPEFMMSRIGASGTVAGGAPGTDHGSLTGLSDDDHPAYLLAAGTRAGSTGSAQDFGSTGIKTDVIAESTGAAGVTVDGLLIQDGSSLDTDALWAAQGDLVKGTGNDAADILSIGADHTVLVSNGTDPSYSAAPPLADIADTGDTNRITLATSGDNVTLTGEVAIAGHLDLDGSDGGLERMIEIKPTTSDVTTWIGIEIAPTLTLDNSNNRLGRGIFGGVTALSPGTGTTGNQVFGLAFQAQAVETTDSGSITFSNMYGIQASSFAQTPIPNNTSTLTVTSMHGSSIGLITNEATGNTLTVTTGYALLISNSFTASGSGGITTYYGIKVPDETVPSTVRLLEIGPSTPYLRIEGNWTRTANQTPFIFSEGTTNAFRVMSTEMAYLSITMDDTVGSITTSLVDIWDEDNSGGTLTKIDNVTAKNITYTASAGTFNADVDGIYVIDISLMVTTTAVDLMTVEIHDGGAQFYSEAWKLHTLTTPAPMSVSVIRALTAGDDIQVFCSIASGTLTIGHGTTFTMHKIADITEDKVLILDNTSV